MSWQNHIGTYLMIVYFLYIYVGIQGAKEKDDLLSPIKCGEIEWFEPFIIGFLVFMFLEIPYWVIYLCFIL